MLPFRNSENSLKKSVQMFVCFFIRTKLFDTVIYTVVRTMKLTE